MTTALKPVPYGSEGSTEPNSRASTGLTYSGGGGRVRYVPIRQDPITDKDDGYNAARINLVRNRWMSQDAALLPHHRQVEKNIRMILGKQWDYYSPSAGQFVDVSKYFTDSERKWRQNPVINWIMNWFILTHARMTENPPIVTFQPSTADDKDAKLARAMDTIWKTLWRDEGMNDVIDRWMACVIPGGESYIKSVVDHSQGDYTYVAKPQQDGTFTLEQEKEGAPKVLVLDPLCCRGQWGSMPWHEKKWQIHRAYLSPEEVFERYQVWCEPDSWQGAQTDGTGGYLQRLQFGSGYFGAVDNKASGQVVQGLGSAAASQEGFVCVDEMWEAPNDALPGYAMTEDEPGGRLLTVTRNHVLYDGNRPFAFKYCSPIRSLSFTVVMGSPKGRTPQEMINPVQETLNRGTRQILEHRNLMSNPKILIDNSSGIQEKQITNAPGEKIFFNMKPGVSNPISYLQPASLGQDVWRIQEWLESTIDKLGNVTGATGEAPSDDPSGVAIKQLRYNSDRYIGAVAKRAVSEIVKLIEDQIVMLPSIWPEEKILAYAGEDDVYINQTIYPDLWSGSVHIIPDMDSMVPEGREEKQGRITTLYQLGAFGPPGSPQAAQTLLKQINYPHMNRLDISGGGDRVTAQQAMNDLVRGATVDQIYINQWYNFDVWQGTFRDFIAGPQFKDLDPNIKQQFLLTMEKIQVARVAAQTLAMQQAAPLAALQGAMQNQIAAAAGPPPGMVGASPPGAHGAPHGPPGAPTQGHGDHSAGTPQKGALQPTPQPANTPNVKDA